MIGCIIKSSIAEKEYPSRSQYSNKLVVLKNSCLFDFQALEVPLEM